MSNQFLPPEWDSIVYQRTETKEETWPKHIWVSPYSPRKPRKFLTKTSSSSPVLYQNIYEKIKRQEGRHRDIRVRRWVSWPGQFPCLQGQKILCPTGQYPFSLLMNSVGCSNPKDPGICSVPQASVHILRYLYMLLSSLIASQEGFSKPLPLISLNRDCALAGINLTWYPDSPLDDNPTLIKTVKNCFVTSIRARLLWLPSKSSIFMLSLGLLKKTSGSQRSNFKVTVLRECQFCHSCTCLEVWMGVEFCKPHYWAPVQIQQKIRKRKVWMQENKMPPPASHSRADQSSLAFCFLVCSLLWALLLLQC